MGEFNILFESYINELRKAVELEKQRIENIKNKQRANFKSDHDLNNYVKTNFGPIGCMGRIIAVFRKYWLKCNELNQYNEEKGIQEYVNPKDFTVDWLSGDNYDLYEIIEEMPYYPIGIDENGNAC